MFDHRPFVERYGLPPRMDGQRALDVGAQDGFWSFELERRGAEVVALDVSDPKRLDWPARLREQGERGEAGFQIGESTGFELAREALGSRVERVDLSVYDATPQRLGHFDLVFSGSVLMHLRDPVLALERIHALCSGRLIAAEEYSPRVEWLPGRRRYAEFRGEWPWMTWWIPSSKTWMSMIRCAGFVDVTRHARFRLPFRDRRGGVPHAVFHARVPSQS